MAKKTEIDEEIIEVVDPEAGTEVEQVEETIIPAAQLAEPVKGRLRTFMAAKYPDRTYANDAEFENVVAEWAEDAERELIGYRSSDETIRRVSAEHPEIIEIVEDLARDPKMPLTVAIARNIDVEEFYPQEGEPDFEAMYKARENRMSRRKEREVYERQLQKNLDESRDIVLNFYEEQGLEEADAIALEQFIDEIIGNYLDGRITPRELEIFYKAMNYERDMKEAREVGKTEGMNAKIDAVRERRRQATDGLPAPGGSAGVLPPPASGSKLEAILSQLTDERKTVDSLFRKNR